jgi:hypothetical protein
MPVAITSVAITELGEAIVYFDAAVDVSTMSSGVPYVLAPVTALASPACVYDAEVLGGFASAKLWFAPDLSPTADYTLTVSITDAAGATNTASTAIAAPNVAVPQEDEWYHGVLRAWSSSTGQTLQELGGVPATLLVKDIRPGDDRVFVESTLGFPDEGFVHVGRRLYRYTSRGPACFEGVQHRGPSSSARWSTSVGTLDIADAVSARQLVSLDVSGALPPGSTAYLARERTPLSDPNGIL